MDLLRITRRLAAEGRAAAERNAAWLQAHMSPFFFQAMTDEQEAIVWLARDMEQLRRNRNLILVNREELLIIACVNRPGSLYDTLRRITGQNISYAMYSRSNAPMPGTHEELEIQRYEFDCRANRDINPADDVPFPKGMVSVVRREMRHLYPGFDSSKLDSLLKVLWLNNENYVRMSPPTRLARLVWLLERGIDSGGLFFDGARVDRQGVKETRILVAIGNPNQEDILLQILEVFKRLEVGIRRAYCQTIATGIHTYFLGVFFVQDHKDEPLEPDSFLFSRLMRELCITRIVSTQSPVYHSFVTKGLLTGDDAALFNSLIAFCHTSLAHNQPDRFGSESVRRAFLDHPEMAQQLIHLFRLRFNPAQQDRENLYAAKLAEVRENVEGYNTGHRWLDDIRRSIYRCGLLLITHTLKTNFFIVEKQALAFRLDPLYLREMGKEFTADLPESLPFRITFFFSRFGAGYHIGFSDIARGGWRTVIARGADDFITATNTLFREAYVLAHTQHLKNKDIYEGGAKLVLALDVSDLDQPRSEAESNRLYQLQYGVCGAFLDIFVTDSGKARDQRVIDYYGDDEPIEIGPDENMPDDMIEDIAELSRKRGYILGIGIMSSKRIGINHKLYGVTSTGVVTFAAITMAEVAGIDMARDRFSLKMTGGPNGDVAGNCLRILLEQCPAMELRLMLDGAAAVYDPAGIDHGELGRLALRHDLDAFNPERLGVDGFILFRSGKKLEGLRETYRRITRTRDGLREEWLDIDTFGHLYTTLLFSVKADLFIPAGGRPETIDGQNWSRFFDGEGEPGARIIVEGANSFITPEARLQLQNRGVTIMRDSSANKCGVISSSYEIIANLLLSPEEFLRHKERYVEDVLEILKKRAGDEATLILRRRREAAGSPLCTEISEAISLEINAHYARLFTFFSARPELCLKHPFRQALISHLPRMLRDMPQFRKRIGRLPVKYRCAILAAEIGSSLVYAGDSDADFESMIRRHLARTA